MKKLLLDKIMNIIKKYYNYNDIKLKEIRYGLEALYLSIVKIIVIVIISLILKTTKELLLILLFYGILRLFGFGVHAKKSIHCWITSVPLFSLLPYLVNKISINSYIIFSISILALILLSIYAPADTEKRPLINKKKRIVYKLLTIIISLIYIILIVYINSDYLRIILFFSILIETVLVLPITYMLLGVKYNNYKRYIRKEDRK